MNTYERPQDSSAEAISLLGFVVAGLVSLILLFVLSSSLNAPLAAALAVFAAIAVFILDAISFGSRMGKP